MHTKIMASGAKEQSNKVGGQCLRMNIKLRDPIAIKVVAHKYFIGINQLIQDALKEDHDEFKVHCLGSNTRLLL